MFDVMICCTTNSNLINDGKEYYNFLPSINFLTAADNLMVGFPFMFIVVSDAIWIMLSGKAVSLFNSR